MKKKLSVVIPSRTQENQLKFLKRATESIKSQSIAGEFDIDVIIGVDHGQHIGHEASEKLKVRCVESVHQSQAAALNAAVREVDDGYLAFLEDDDEWQPNYLKYAMHCLGVADFVSSTQLEFDETDRVLRVNDFPTPSGWLMPISAFKLVGEFDETFRLHLDNEWLGRLSATKLKRLHLVESTAPVDMRYTKQVRPWLYNLQKSTANVCKLVRHESPYPLVKRLVHSKSGMARISTDPEFQAISQNERKRLIEMYGKNPW